jgi:hypothetical protein
MTEVRTPVAPERGRAQLFSEAVMRDGLANHVSGTLNGVLSYGCWMG